MHTDLLPQLAIVIGTACAVGFVLHLLKQPLVAAYILAGVLISFFQIGGISSLESLSFLPTIGVAFLLFLIGLELDFRELRQIGKVIVLASLTQMAVTTAFVALLFAWLGFGAIESVLIGLALSFSSTIVVIKLLVDRHEITTLHGKVAIGMLIVEDIVAVIALMFLSLTSSVLDTGFTQLFPLAALVGKAIFLFSVVYLLIKVVIPKLFGFLAQNHELLFLTSIFWCFLFATFTTLLGFSLEIGAFLGGVSLASSPYRYQVAGRLKPLRDFFIAIFFVLLGMSVVYTDVVRELPLILVFSFLALVIKPIEIMLIMSALRFRKYTSFHTASALSQVSEFSVILLVTAQVNGLIGNDMIQIFTATTIITIFVSSILVNNNEKIYPVFAKVIKYFERKSPAVKKLFNDDLADHVILIGANRAGEPIMEYFKDKDTANVVIVDYDPDVVKELENQKIPVIFGDISDPEILEQLNLDKAKLVISSIREYKQNVLLLDSAKQAASKARFIVAAMDEKEAQALQKHGADEVIIPLELEGKYIVHIISKYWDELFKD